jgi:hypothetical protein
VSGTGISGAPTSRRDSRGGSDRAARGRALVRRAARSCRRRSRPPTPPPAIRDHARQVLRDLVRLRTRSLRVRRGPRRWPTRPRGARRGAAVARGERRQSGTFHLV